MVPSAALGLLPRDTGCGTGGTEVAQPRPRAAGKGPTALEWEREAGATLTMLDVLPEDPVLGVILERDEAALLGAAHLPGESGKSGCVSAPIPSTSLFSLVTDPVSRGCGKSGLGRDTPGQDDHPKCPAGQRHVAAQASIPCATN